MPPINTTQRPVNARTGEVMTDAQATESFSIMANETYALIESWQGSGYQATEALAALIDGCAHIVAASRLPHHAEQELLDQAGSRLIKTLLAIKQISVLATQKHQGSA